MKDHNLQLMLQVSPGAADLLTSLREHLAFVTDHVSPLISPSLLDQVAMGVDSLLLSNVSMSRISWIGLDRKGCGKLKRHGGVRNFSRCGSSYVCKNNGARGGVICMFL